MGNFRSGLPAAAPALAATLAVAGCASQPENLGISDGHLRPCSSAPHCVSSEAPNTDTRWVEPLRLRGDIDTAWAEVIKTVASMPRTRIVTQTDNYLHAEVISPWHVYTDDLELFLLQEEQLIHTRSSSRVGYYDFNVNRRRIDDLRRKLQHNGFIE